MKSFCVTVPCKTYIRKYFSSRYAVIGNKIPLNNKSEFTDTLLTKISYSPVRKTPENYLTVYFETLNDSIRFELPADLFYRVKTDLTRQQIYRINRYLEHVFNADLHRTIVVAAVFSVPRRKVIKAFTEYYDIDLSEDITLDGLKKAATIFAKSPIAQDFFLAKFSSPLFDIELSN